MSVDNEYIFKVVLIGDKMVGKTSLIDRFVQRGYQGEYMGTIGLNVSTKTIDVDIENEKYRANLVIYDLAAEETFEDLFGPFAKGSVASIIVFDLTRENTLDSVDDWISRLLNLNDEALKNSLLIGNKQDLKQVREINEEKGMKKADEYNLISYVECSAKNNQNVEEAFISLTKHVLMDALKE